MEPGDLAQLSIGDITDKDFLHSLGPRPPPKKKTTREKPTEVGDSLEPTEVDDNLPIEALLS